MGIGALKIENGNVVEIKDLGDEIYDMDIGDDEWLELCKNLRRIVKFYYTGCVIKWRGVPTDEEILWERKEYI